MKSFEVINEWCTLEQVLDDIEFTKKTSKGKVANVSAVFDIEATSFYEDGEKRAVMYAWVFGINGRCIRGRTWEEFLSLTKKIQEKYNLKNDKRLIVYVHNLSYEFQWFKQLFEWYNVFAIDERKPVYAITTSGIEFRCSYILSGYNLETLGKNLLKYKVNKAVGDLDYDLVRHTSTPLTEKEWGYILNDGLVVMAFIQEEIERTGDIRKIPLTKTGYVRNLCKEACFNGKERYAYYELRNNLTLDIENYKQFKRTYTGGFTHGNARKIGKIHYNVSSYDFTSSYPAVMVSERYPMSKPISYNVKDFKEFKEMMRKYCCMFDAEFYNIEEKVKFEHFISVSRCLEIDNEVVDNGRVVEADRLIIPLTEQDYDIIEKMYKWDRIVIYNFKYMYRAYLPKELVMTALDLYVKKTTLKGVQGKEDEYQVSKGMLNSLYGCCVTDPCRSEITYENDLGWYSSVKDLEDGLQKYNMSRTRFLYYAWGVWITAYAKHNLFTGILECGQDYIYSDTDSLKILNKENHKEYFDNYNKEITNKIIECLEFYEIPFSMAKPKTIKGVAKPLGVWDYEGTYSMFKTLGAKRYMYVEDGELHITIAGVSKKKGKLFLERKFKTMENIFKHFNDKLDFPASYTYKENNEIKEDTASGKLTHTYLDDEMTGVVVDYLGNSCSYKEKSAVHLEKADYCLSLESDFLNYIKGVNEDVL